MVVVMIMMMIMGGDEWVVKSQKYLLSVGKSCFHLFPSVSGVYHVTQILGSSITVHVHLYKKNHRQLNDNFKIYFNENVPFVHF